MNEQFKAGISCLKLITIMFESFQFGQHMLLFLEVQFQLSGFGQQVGPSCQIRNEDPPSITNSFRRDVLVSFGIAFDGRDVNATFMRESAVADKSSARIQGQISNFTNEAGCFT